MKLQFLILLAASIATSAFGEAETKYDDPDATLAELRNVSAACSKMVDGAVQDEIFGIQMVRIGDTCVIINGDEIDQHVRVFLEEQKLDWAGVGLWVKAIPSSE